MLAKGAKAAYNFAQTPVGKELISQGIQGYAQGAQAEELAKREREAYREKHYGGKGDLQKAGNFGDIGKFEYNQPA